ncbi:MAG TPA: HPr family phosphocarrier protein [Pseudomonadales bacterium]|nr:HPr family phosphocarrier protein [Pseudomonadales bacterium]
MTETTLDIINKLGLHARAASKLTNLCARFNSKIIFSKLVNNEKKQPADGKSIMALMLLAAGKGTQLHVSCEGKDEHEAIAAISELFANRFDESE